MSAPQNLHASAFTLSTNFTLNNQANVYSYDKRDKRVIANRAANKGRQRGWLDYVSGLVEMRDRVG